MDGGTNPKTWVIISVLFVGIHCTIAAGGTIYVDETKNGDGSSWATAYKYLQDALRSAQSGDEIRVAEGVYKPDEDTAHPNGSGSRYETFRLKNGVVIKGGYAGYGEPDPDARHFELYETILSGDLNGDDGPDFANNGENSYHVVTGSWINATAVLDGFTITAGNAGSGVGGGMVNFGDSSPTLNNCTFSDNSAGEGGGMHNRTGSSPTVTNCIFSGNSADWGGGMTNWDYSSPTLTNCTFTGNSASEDGGGMSNDNSSPTIANCILWGNTASSGSQIYNDGTSSATVSYSDVQGGWLGAGNIAADPLFIDVSNGDLRLLPDSPCIDAGDNTAVPGGVMTDLDGNPRFVDDPYTVDTGNGTPPIVDMGAYEYCPPSIQGQIAHWNFDEGQGSVAYDSAGENHGTLMNGPQWTTGQIDGALGLDGVDDYVEITGYKGISGTSARTCAAWIKTDTNGQIISWGEETVGRKWTFRVDFNGTVRAEVAGGGINSSTAVDDGAWHHVAVVWENDGSPYICDAMLYVDGQQETTSCPGDKEMNTASYANVRIGKAFIANRNFDGTIDDVRIYDRALSAEEVEQLYQDGLPELVSLEIVGPNEVAENFTAQYKAIAHYDNDTTKDVTDSVDWSVEPNDIADIDAGLLEAEEIYESEDITIYAQYTEGEVTVEAEKPVSIFAICPSGSALSFDGVDDYVDCGNDPSLEVGDDSLTIATWVKTPDENQRAPISYKRQPVPPYEQYSLGIGGDDPWSPLSVGKKFQLNYIESPGNYRGAVTDNEYVDGDWHHVVAIADKVKEEIIFYVDGIRVDSTLVRDSGSWPTVNNTDPLYIGYNAGDRYFNGVIDDVRIYNQALSAEEIQANMHTKLAGDEDGLVAYWDFDEGEGEIAGDSSGNGNDGTIVGAEWVQSDAPVGICTPVAIDIKPGSCPNPLNVASRGVLPAAILGSEDFDISTIDAASIFLEGVPAIRSSYEDVAAPVSDANECECTTEGPDGYVDLTLKFGTQEIVEELINWPGELAEGQTLMLRLRGELFDDTAIAGADCVVLVGNVPRHLFIRISDINGDGVINMVDLAQLAEYWLESYEVEY